MRSNLQLFLCSFSNLEIVITKLSSQKWALISFWRLLNGLLLTCSCTLDRLKSSYQALRDLPAAATRRCRRALRRPSREAPPRTLRGRWSGGRWACPCTWTGGRRRAPRPSRQSARTGTGTRRSSRAQSSVGVVSVDSDDSRVWIGRNTWTILGQDKTGCFGHF